MTQYRLNSQIPYSISPQNSYFDSIPPAQFSIFLLNIGSNTNFLTRFDSNIINYSYFRRKVINYSWRRVKTHLLFIISAKNSLIIMNLLISRSILATTTTIIWVKQASWLIYEPGNACGSWIWVSAVCVLRVKQASFPWPNAKNQINIVSFWSYRHMVSITDNMGDSFMIGDAGKAGERQPWQLETWGSAEQEWSYLWKSVSDKGDRNLHFYF